jgi:hypothetical protein
VKPDGPASTSEAVTPETPPELPEWARLRKPTQARRLKTWLSSPPWWVQSVVAALLVGVFVAVVSILWQKSISDGQATQATRLENLRFVRQLSSESGVVARPFSGFDLQGQNLAGLDLTGAQLDKAKLQDADLRASHLSCRPQPVGRLAIQPEPGSCANLASTDLTDVGDLTGVHYDEKTKWPVGFKSPPPAKP